MANSILISGTYKIVENKVLYDIVIFATNNTPVIQCIAGKKLELDNYGYLWDEVKKIVLDYFEDQSYFDGAYTVYQENLINSNS